VKLSPRGEDPLFAPSFFKHYVKSVHPRAGVNKGVNNSPRGQIYSLGAKFTLGENFTSLGQQIFLKNRHKVSFKNSVIIRVTTRVCQKIAQNVNPRL
jgi:hypothetical protein